MELSENATILKQLREMVKKSEMAQTGIKGTPGGDVKSESSAESTEKTNKNEVGADKNKPQEYSQKPATDNQKSEPLAGAKKASVQDLGSEVLKDLEKESALAQTDIKGTPGGDVKSEKTPDSTETTNKNEVGADKNKPQEYAQKPAPDHQGSEPLAGAKKAEATVDEMAAKVGSYNLGRQFAAALLKQAAFSQVNDVELRKQAGRRDFETLISEASANLEVPAQPDFSVEIAKQAEAQGEAYFDDLMKQASLETVLSENEALRSKLAELETKVTGVVSTAEAAKSTLDKKAAEEAEAAKETAQVLKIAHAVKALLDADAATK